MKIKSRCTNFSKLFVLGTFALLLFVVSCNKEEVLENEAFIVAEAVSVPSGSSKTIQAEDYDNMRGVRTESTSDSGGGQNVGYIDSGDFLEYDINVANAGRYKFQFRVASRSNNSKFDFFQNNRKLSNVNKAVTGGWQTWKTTTKTVDLNAGSSTLKILATGSGWNLNYIKIIPVDVDDNGGGGNNGGSGSAAAIIGGMNSDWKLNAFSGSLNIGSGSYGEDGANGLDYEDRASISDNNNWFFDTSGYAAFKCHVGNPSSNGSGNMRSELRELNGNGNEIEWDGTTNTTHRMRYKVQIRQLPSSGKVAFGQIHGEGQFDDVIRVQLEDSNANRGTNNGAGSGTYNVTIKGYVTEVLDRDNRNESWATMQMDREYDVEITMRNEEVKVYLNGNNIYTSKKVDSDENYFKAGAYLQSAQEDKAPQLRRNSNNFGEVWIKNLTVNH